MAVRRPLGRLVTIMRICSFVPGATELLFELGVGERLVGRSHECDYPPAANSVPVLIRPLLDSDRATSGEIDRQVRRRLEAGQALYELDLQGLASARPDVIVVQDVCGVCAVTTGQVAAACAELSLTPQIVTLHLSTIADLMQAIDHVGATVQQAQRADRLRRSLQSRLDQVQRRLGSRTDRPRVACIEWLDPLYVAGHWVPEMVALAGGMNLLAEPGSPSRRITWNELVEADPEVVVLMPCGFSLARTLAEFRPDHPATPWHRLAAGRTGRMFAVEASAYFSRSGPRIVDGVERLAALCYSKPEAPLPDGVARLPLMSETITK